MLNLPCNCEGCKLSERINELRAKHELTGQLTELEINELKFITDKLTLGVDHDQLAK